MELATIKKFFSIKQAGYTLVALLPIQPDPLPVNFPNCRQLISAWHQISSTKWCIIAPDQVLCFRTSHMTIQ